MRQIIVFLFLLMLMLFQWFQPFWTQIYVNKQNIANTLVNTTVNQSIITGYVTPTQIQNLKQEYSNLTGTLTSDITVTGTFTPVPRGNTVALTMYAPAGAIYVFSIFGNPQPSIAATATAVSEAVS